MNKKFIIPFMGFITGIVMCSISIPSRITIGNFPMEHVILLPYNPEWIGIYNEEAAMVASALGPKRVVNIQHFGSTSIPGMITKPIIDILVGLDEFALEDTELQALKDLGYEFIEQSAYCQRFYLHKRKGHNVNISLTRYNSATWKDCLSVRDYLREHPQERYAYMDVKLRALLDGNTNIYQYSEYKREFVKKLTDRARAWRSDE